MIFLQQQNNKLNGERKDETLNPEREGHGLL
jgi:hypothetical protein